MDVQRRRGQGSGGERVVGRASFESFSGVGGGQKLPGRGGGPERRELQEVAVSCSYFFAG